MHTPVETRLWAYRDRHFELGRMPLLMGIVNVTPDSFSDGGRFLDHRAAVAHAVDLVADGADLIDIGGESTRPGSTPVSTDEQLRRVIPVVEQLAGETAAPISIDTTDSQVAEQAIRAGATIVNDISGLQFDARMPAVCRDADVGVICMHIQGTPETMQNDPHYGDVVAEVCQFFGRRLEALAEAGIAAERMVLDPGIGFGKTADHNLQLLRHIERLRSLGRPVLVGHSRKRFLGKLLNRKLDERTWGTVGTSIALAAQSTDILRVHDIRATRDALLAWTAIIGRNLS